MSELLPCITYLSPTQLQVVRHALRLAYRAHDGQKRKSGEPYIIHPVEVARILGQLEMDWETVVAGLLHDTVEDTDVVSFEQIEASYGPAVRRIVEGETKVSKLGKVKDGSKADVKADDLRQMFLAMTEEVRVIIVKLADRLHNMRTLTHMPPHKQKYIAMETLSVFAPLARLLGMYHIKTELEGLSFRYAYPEEYLDVSERRLHLCMALRRFSTHLLSPSLILLLSDGAGGPLILATFSPLPSLNIPFQTELEDLSFRYAYPEEYLDVSERMLHLCTQQQTALDEYLPFLSLSRSGTCNARGSDAEGQVFGSHDFRGEGGDSVQGTIQHIQEGGGNRRQGGGDPRDQLPLCFTPYSLPHPHSSPSPPLTCSIFKKVVETGAKVEEIHEISQIRVVLSMDDADDQPDSSSRNIAQQVTKGGLRGDGGVLPCVGSRARPVAASPRHGTSPITGQHYHILLTAVLLCHLSDQPAPRRIPSPWQVKDYIATPKPNGYQSLHTTVLPLGASSLFPMEVQIRTDHMDKLAKWDYIATPKPNGYQSLHTTVLPLGASSLFPVEVQIRTDHMDKLAEWATPKPNGYQSLHTTVLPLGASSLFPVEVQIRTDHMDKLAEWGIAAHHTGRHPHLLLHGEQQEGQAQQGRKGRQEGQGQVKQLADGSEDLAGLLLPGLDYSTTDDSEGDSDSSGSDDEPGLPPLASTISSVAVCGGVTETQSSWSNDADVARRVSWLNSIREWQEEFVGAISAREFVDTVTCDLFGSRIFVFTPKGEVKNLPKGATVIDYAYHIHTDVGNRMVAAKVNGNFVPPTYALSNGEVVEVLTYKGGSGGSRKGFKQRQQWLQHAKTRSARHKLTKTLNKGRQGRSAVGEGEAGTGSRKGRSGEVGRSIDGTLGRREVGFGRVGLGEVGSETGLAGRGHPAGESSSEVLQFSDDGAAADVASTRLAAGDADVSLASADVELLEGRSRDDVDGSGGAGVGSREEGVDELVSRLLEGVTGEARLDGSGGGGEASVVGRGNGESIGVARPQAVGYSPQPQDKTGGSAAAAAPAVAAVPEPTAAGPQAVAAEAAGATAGAESISLESAGVSERGRVPEGGRASEGGGACVDAFAEFEEWQTQTVAMWQFLSGRRKVVLWLAVQCYDRTGMLAEVSKIVTESGLLICTHAGRTNQEAGTGVMLFEVDGLDPDFDVISDKLLAVDGVLSFALGCTLANSSRFWPWSK
ncbi:unnamed protein product [Closterium sp. NIES-64]|nr:unnamed protein product [Closterium sp. NIES-64]